MKIAGLIKKGNQGQFPADRENIQRAENKQDDALERGESGIGDEMADHVDVAGHHGHDVADA
jgi:hypothetical protein